MNDGISQLSDSDRGARSESVNNACPIQGPACVTVSVNITKIDRMDRRGFFTSHYTCNGKKTLCGLALEVTQKFCENGFCCRCEKIAMRCQKDAAAASVK